MSHRKGKKQLSLIDILDKLEESDDDDFNYDIFGEGTNIQNKLEDSKSDEESEESDDDERRGREPGVQEGLVGTLHPKASLKPKTGEVVVGSSPTLDVL